MKLKDKIKNILKNIKKYSVITITVSEEEIEKEYERYMSEKLNKIQNPVDDYFNGNINLTDNNNLDINNNNNISENSPDLNLDIKLVTKTIEDPEKAKIINDKAIEEAKTVLDNAIQGFNDSIATLENNEANLNEIIKKSGDNAEVAEAIVKEARTLRDLFLDMKNHFSELAVRLTDIISKWSADGKILTALIIGVGIAGGAYVTYKIVFSPTNGPRIPPQVDVVSNIRDNIPNEDHPVRDVVRRMIGNANFRDAGNMGISVILTMSVLKALGKL